MPQRLDLGRGGFSPVEVAKAYRDEHPHLFDDATDGELIKALETDDPEVFQLVDPLLIGSEILPHYAKGAPPPPGPLPTPPVPQSFFDTAMEIGLGIVPTTGGALIGSLGGPAGTATGGFIGAGLGSAASQYYQMHYGNREEYSPGAMAFDATLGALNPASRGTSRLAKTASQVGFGAGFGGASSVGHSLIEQGQLPGGSEVGTSMLLGGAFGGATHLGFEAVRAAKEAQLGQKLLDLYKGRTRTAAQPTPSDLHTAQQAKSYLEELAALNAPPVPIPPMQPGLTESPYAAGPAQPQLPRGRGDPGAFRAYPPGVNPQIELVGQGAPPANRIIGGQDVGVGSGPPPTLGDVVAQTTAGTAEVGPPRLRSRPLELTAESGVPRGTSAAPPLLERPTVSQEGPTRQGARMGGRPATAEQPRIPSTSEPIPLDRTYATGPNAGPRRPGEAHATPRMVRRRLQIGKTFRFERTPSDLHAEDPGTYPPEVRRELARMAEELTAFTYEPPRQIDTPEGGGNRGRGYTHYTKATPGAPVFDEIKDAAMGARAHATRLEVLQDLRAALLEGKGSALSDAAAQVARQRLQMEAVGDKTGSHRLPPGAGDAIIGWVDEAGNQALPDQDLSPFEREARGETNGGLLAVLRLAEEGPVNPEVQGYFDAARNEAVRRGLIRPQQGGLPMEGPGGAKGPTLFDFEGGEIPPEPGVGEAPPGPPESGTGGPIQWGEEGPAGRAAKDIAAGRTQATFGEPPSGITERRHAELLRKFGGGTETARQQAYPEARPEIVQSGPPPPLVPRSPNLKEPFGPDVQPELPGTEGVRQQETPTPAVADLPFALSPPPAPPARIGERTPAPLLQRLLDEEGVLILTVPSGDRKGLREWLATQEKEHGGTPWFARVEHYMEEGEWGKAWQVAASASARSYSAAFANAKTPQQERMLAEALKGTPLQADLPAQIVAVGRTGQQTRPAPKVSDFPPSQHIGMKVKGVTLGPAGILNLGAPQQRTPIGSRAKTLDRDIIESFVDAMEEHPEFMHLVRGNRDTAIRLSTQVADLIAQGHIPFDYANFPGMTRYEVGRQYRNTLSEAGRTLQTHSAFVQKFDTELHEMQDRMDIGGALGRPGGEIGGPPPPRGVRGRPLTAEADAAITRIATNLNLAQADRAAMLNDLRPKPPQSLGQALVNSQYAFLTSGLPTAIRNAISFGQRYSVEVLDDLATAGAGRFLGGKEAAVGREAGARAGERVTALTSGREGVFPRPAWVKRGLAETYEDIYNLTTDVLLKGAPPNDVRQTLRIFQAYPAQAAHLTGAILGEQVPVVPGKSSILNALGHPRVQRWLQIWNRAQEFPTRALAADTHFRAQLRAQGFNPAEVLADPDLGRMAERVGGGHALERMIFRAVADAREMTYAGGFAKNSVPGWAVHMVQEAWPAKLAVRFPAFNFARAPRWIYDHGPWALADLVRLPFDRKGWTSTGKYLGGGRLYRGLKAQGYETDLIPALRGEIAEQEGTLGDTIGELQATSREWSVRQRQVARLERRAQAGLPDTPTALSEATALRDQLARRRGRLQDTLKETNRTIGDLEKQEAGLWKEVQNATGISAPTYASWFGRMASGTVSMLGAAVVMRSSEYAEGTRYDQLKIPRGEGQDPWNLDFSAFAPTPQFMFVADVLVDFERHTDWPAVLQEMQEEFSPPALGAAVGMGAAIGGQAGPLGAGAGAILGGSAEESLKWNRAIWNHYEGKYTPGTLGADFGRAFLSMSRMAGTALTIQDLMTRNGWPGLQDVADAAVGTIGQFLAGYATPLGQIKDLAGTVSPEEATVRHVPRTSQVDPASWSYPLAQPLARVPGLNRLLPEATSQTTGRPIRSEHAGVRTLTGIGGAPSDFIQEEVRRVGVPGSSVYIRETGDAGLDKMVAETYAQILQQELPQILEDPQYVELGTPARQRDFLQRYVFPPLKRAALGETRSLLGESRFTEATVRGEESRRRQRQQKLLDALEAETPQEASQPEDLVGTPPPGPPAPSAGTSVAPPGPPPGF